MLILFSAGFIFPILSGLFFGLHKGDIFIFQVLSPLLFTQFKCCWKHSLFEIPIWFCEMILGIGSALSIPPDTQNHLLRTPTILWNGVSFRFLPRPFLLHIFVNKPFFIVCHCSFKTGVVFVVWTENRRWKRDPFISFPLNCESPKHSDSHIQLYSNTLQRS